VDLRARLADLTPAVVRGSWANHEHVQGYGVFGLPFTSGHVLALRVFPVNDFAPYVTVWHRDAEGTWTIYYDAPRSDVACPRYYGPATSGVRPASIDLTWTGPGELSIHMDTPRLDWTVQMVEPPLLRVMNVISRRLPLWTWQQPALLKPREWTARWLGLGRIQLAGPMPSGHVGVLMPQELFFVDRSHADLDGVDLGGPASLKTNPTIGTVPLPARGTFAIGQAHWVIRDPQEYATTRQELGVAARLTTLPT
jgi:hypothetical protein